MSWYGLDIKQQSWSIVIYYTVTSLFCFKISKLFCGFKLIVKKIVTPLILNSGCHEY